MATQYAFYYDQNRCMGCSTCVVSCKDWNQVEPGQARWRRLRVVEEGAFPQTAVFSLAMGCNHCQDPACVKACPIGAIYKRPEDGIVLVDRSRCQSLRSCEARCPYGAPQFGSDTQEPVQDPSWTVAHPMQKCTFCVDRWAAGKKPACVDSCPQRAIDAGTVEEIKAKYPNAQQIIGGVPHLTSIRSDRDPAGNMLDTDTGPSFFINVRTP
jgi:anaerobic dimethyl sulfoxide reductase subunit B (iron-sulfur subunit)